ncbi:hypothetical protein [Solirubrobacter soli]|uniref:hypothetical protein n=1 Tax=Solirubrobacter soli TaxID=363832 RepID=UPI0004194BBE|nr:hypothetical protein [Solirubrobacter soli]
MKKRPKPAPTHLDGHEQASICIQLALDVVYDPRPDDRGNVMAVALVTTERTVALAINAN